MGNPFFLKEAMADLKMHPKIFYLNLPSLLGTSTNSVLSSRKSFTHIIIANFLLFFFTFSLFKVKTNNE